MLGKDIQMVKDEMDVVAEIEKGIKILVNARVEVVSPDKLSPDGGISFEEIVRFYKGDLPQGADRLFGVRFKNAASRPREGILIQGQSVKIQDGTEFDVYPTVDS